MHFSRTLLLFSCILSGFAATVNDVKNQITSLSSQLGTIATLVQAFPNVGGNVLQALTIQSVAMATILGVDTLTTLVQSVPLPISDQDGRSVLDVLESVEPSMNAASQALIAKKAAFSRLTSILLPTGSAIGLIRQGLADLKTNLNEAEDAIAAAAPASLLDEGNAIRARIISVLDATIAAYA